MKIIKTFLIALALGAVAFACGGQEITKKDFSYITVYPAQPNELGALTIYQPIACNDSIKASFEVSDSTIYFSVNQDTFMYELDTVYVTNNKHVVYSGTEQLPPTLEYAEFHLWNDPEEDGSPLVLYAAKSFVLIRLTNYKRDCNDI